LPALAWLLPLLLCTGCSTTPGAIWSQVVPEQRDLDIREPGQFAKAPIPPIPSPTTVSNPAPDVSPKELSLDEALRISLANSNVIRFLAGTTAVASGQTIYDPAIVNTTIDDARAPFDPIVTARNAFNRTELPEAFFDPLDARRALIAGTRVDDYALGLGMSKKNVAGGTVSFDYADNFDRFHPGTFPLNPQDRSALTLSYTQPLLQGGGVAVNLAPIVIARINTELSYFQLKDSVQESVRGVIEAYWNVVFARTDVWARQKQVEQAQFTVALAEAKERTGSGNIRDVAQAKVTLANLKATLVAAEANLLQRDDALRNILGLPPNEPERITPTTPPTRQQVVPRWAEILQLAEDRRPDLIELKLILEADRQMLIQAQNQALPKVDTTMLYRWNGLEGEAPNRVRLQTGAGQFTDWTLGVNFSVPLGLRMGRAGVRRTQLIIARDEANLEQGLHSAAHTLSGNVRNLAQFYEQYQAYREARTAARLNLEQQITAWKTGGIRDVILLNVLQAITDWGNAVSAEAQSLAQYNIELANLERQTGTILETHGVRFVEESFQAVGPLGHLCKPRAYPYGVSPGPNENKYPVEKEPIEKRLEKETPKLLGD
jgi:outer membrane protein TolC